MCIGDEPLSRALPYFISGFASLIFLILFHNKCFIKKFDKKVVRFLRIFLIGLTVILFLVAFSEFLITYKEMCVP